MAALVKGFRVVFCHPVVALLDTGRSPFRTTRSRLGGRPLHGMLASRRLSGLRPVENFTRHPRRGTVFLGSVRACTERGETPPPPAMILSGRRLAYTHPSRTSRGLKPSPGRRKEQAQRARKAINAFLLFCKWALRGAQLSPSNAGRPAHPPWGDKRVPPRAKG